MMMVLFMTTKCGKRDMIAHSKEPDQANHQERGNNRNGNGASQRIQEPIEYSSCHTCHGVYFFLEYYRLVVKQYIADDPPCCSGDTPHEYRYPERMIEGERLLKTSNSEQCQSQRVKDKPGIRQAFHESSENNNEEQCCCCAQHVHRISHPERGDAKHHVTNCSSANSHCKTTNISPKPVELLTCRMANARYSKSKGPQKLEDLLQCTYQL